VERKYEIEEVFFSLVLFMSNLLKFSTIWFTFVCMRAHVRVYTLQGKAVKICDIPHLIVKHSV
jgi:hypothetical protein